MKLFKLQEKDRKQTLQISRLVFPSNRLQGKNAFLKGTSG